MHTNPTRIQAPSTDFIDQWAISFSALYTIKDQDVVALGEIRLPSSGIALEVIKITPAMLQKDHKLAAEVQLLAQKGLVGFAYADTNTIQFRHDIAQQLQNINQFRVYNHANLQSSHMEDNIQVEGIDEIAYSKLANLPPNESEKVEKEKEKKKEEKLAKESRASHHIHHEREPVAASAAPSKPKSKIGVHRTAASEVQQEYQNRKIRSTVRKKTEREREKEKIEREEIKREEKNREIVHKDVRESHQRANRNFGDAKEKTTSAAGRKTTDAERPKLKKSEGTRNLKTKSAETVKHRAKKDH